MKRAIQITIPEPCNQSWEEMQPVPGGKYCASCQQNVVDFTRMSDAAIFEYVQKHPTGCGWFYKDQLERDIVLPACQPKRAHISWVMSLLVLLGLSNGAQAQKVKAKPSKTQTSVKRNSLTATAKPDTAQKDCIEQIAPVYQKRNGGSMEMSGGARVASTTIIIDGVVLAPAKKNFWQRLQFWKR